MENAAIAHFDEVTKPFNEVLFFSVIFFGENAKQLRFRLGDFWGLLKNTFPVFLLKSRQTFQILV